MTSQSKELADLREAVKRLETKAERLLEKMVELGFLHEAEADRISGRADDGPEVVQ